MQPRLLLASLSLAAAFCAPAAFSADNALTPAEKSAGWQLLFDGRSFDGWRGYRKETGAPVAGWEVVDGTLHAIAKVRGTELITEKKFNDFELTWEWKLPPAGNNGVKYFVTEDRPYAPHLTIARMARRTDLREAVAVLDAAGPGPEWSAGEVVLFDSDTRSTGAVHTPVARVPLALPGDA